MDRRSFLRLTGATALLGGTLATKSSTMGTAPRAELGNDPVCGEACLRDRLFYNPSFLYAPCPPWPWQGQFYEYPVMAAGAGKACIAPAHGNMVHVPFLRVEKDAMRRENRMIIAALNAAAVCQARQALKGFAKPCIQVMSDVFSCIEANEVAVANIVCHPSADRFLAGNMGQCFDRTCHKKFLERGILGALWGADVLASQEMPPNEFIVTGTPAYVGITSVADPEHVGCVVTDPSLVCRVAFRPDGRPEQIWGSSWNPKA